MYMCNCYDWNAAIMFDDKIFVALGTELVDIGCQIEDGQRDPLRQKLPEAVGILDKAIQRATGPEETVYLHRRAGKRRSPSVAAAYLYWFGDDTTVSFRFSTCIYSPCKCLSSADLFIMVL